MLLPDALVQVDQTLSNQAQGLTAAGWFFVTLAWTTIISTAIFCYRKVLHKSEERKRTAS